MRRTPKEIIADFKRQKQAEEARKKEKKEALRKNKKLEWYEKYNRKQRMLKQAEIEAVKRDKVKVLPSSNANAHSVRQEIGLRLDLVPHNFGDYTNFLDVYQTEEEIREAENDPLEEGRINWEVFHSLIEQFRKENDII